MTDLQVDPAEEPATSGSVDAEVTSSEEKSTRRICVTIQVEGEDRFDLVEEFHKEILDHVTLKENCIEKVIQKLLRERLLHVYGKCSTPSCRLPRTPVPRVPDAGLCNPEDYRLHLLRRDSDIL